MGKEVLGGFEHQVLLATVRLQSSAYTASVVEELDQRTGREAAPAAVYIALQRLEKQGMLTSEVRVEPDSGDRRPRRFFIATAAGLELLANAQRELEALWEGLRLEGGA
jgi:DNA-binding PadR family transcriptional regulator